MIHEAHFEPEVEAHECVGCRLVSLPVYFCLGDVYGGEVKSQVLHFSTNSVCVCRCYALLSHSHCCLCLSISQHVEILKSFVHFLCPPARHKAPRRGFNCLICGKTKRY